VDGRGWLSGWLPAPEVLLAPAAVALALSAAVGVAALAIDLPDRHFGWPQVAAVVVGGASLIGVLPVVAASTDGRWGMPRGDFDQIVASLPSPSESFRTLWIGDAGVVPLRGWPLDAPSLAEPEPGRQLVYATTTGRSPNVENMWPGSRHGATETLTTLLEDAASKGTNRLGARLAPLGIEYVIVPRRPAPVPITTQDASQPDALVDLLASQLDLNRIGVVAGIHVFRNTAWGPAQALLPHGATVSPGPEQVTVPELAGAPEALPHRDGFSASGPLEPGQVYVAAGGGDAWRLQVGGADVPRQDALGWAGVFPVDQAGEGELRLDTPALATLVRLVQAALWLLALAVLWRVRPRRRPVEPDDPDDDLDPVEVVPGPPVPVGADR
jgi:hypothetical protein